MTIRRMALQAAVGNLTQNQSITVDANGFLISAGLLVYAFIQNVSATDKVLGRVSAGAGVIEEIACTSAGRALIDDPDAAAQRTTLGLGNTAAARLALGVVDANDRMPTAMLPTKILNSYWHASFDEITVVAGTWIQSGAASQTDYDPALVGAAGQLVNTTYANNDEIHFGSLSLNAGTYKISVCGLKTDNRGIMEILLGTTSLGTFDLYVVGVSYNIVTSFAYSPTTRVTGNLRIKCTGKNASSTSYGISFSRVEIIRTG